MSIKNRTIILIVKLCSWCIDAFNLGTGSTWPGHIALALNRNIVREIIVQYHLNTILVAGTNGKTTTSTLLHFLLEKNGKTVFQNAEGANLLNGVASTVIRQIELIRRKSPIGIFEIDENTLPVVLSQIQPTAIILLNLFRDQLDRYGEVAIIADKWKDTIKALSPETQLFLNADDPQIMYLGTETKAEKHYFSVPASFFQKKAIPHDVDSIYCPNCGEKLKYKGMTYSHLGDFYCPRCAFKYISGESFAHEKLPYPLLGTYNIYNSNAAVLVAQKVFHINLDAIKRDLPQFTAAYGRQELISYKGRNVLILLSKNPTGFNQSIEVANSVLKIEGSTAMLVLNDRIPDGRDVSWIWDVEFEDLKVKPEDLFISGDRVYDMGLRIKYTCDEQTTINNLYEAVSDAITAAIDHTAQGKTLVVMATYSAMLEVRKVLIGRKIL